MVRMIAVFDAPDELDVDSVEDALNESFEDYDFKVWDSMEDFMLDKRDGMVRGFDE